MRTQKHTGRCRAWLFLTGFQFRQDEPGPRSS